MTDQPAPAHSLEHVWLVKATCAPDAAETRVPFRPAHLARIAELARAGVVVEAGAFADVSASILIVRAADDAAAVAIARTTSTSGTGSGWRSACDRSDASRSSSAGRPASAVAHPPDRRASPLADCAAPRRRRRRADGRREALGLESARIRSERSSSARWRHDRRLGPRDRAARRCAARQVARGGPARWRRPGPTAAARPRGRPGRDAGTLVASTTVSRPRRSRRRASGAGPRRRPRSPTGPPASPATRSRKRVGGDDLGRRGSGARRRWTCRSPARR